MRRHWLIIPLTLGLISVGPVAYAQGEPEWRSWPMGERFGLNVGSFFANLETTVRLDGTGGILGTEISFEQDLGLDDTKTRIMAGGYWRFFKKHRLDFSYFNLDRSGDSTSTVNIRFGDEIFQADLPLHVFLDIEVFNLGYSYSILFDEKKELAFGLALSFQDIATGLKGTGVLAGLDVSESSSVLAPLPTFTGRFAYEKTPTWIVDTSMGYFTIDVDSGGDELSGDIIAANAGVKWQLLKHFHLGLLYQWFRVDVDTKNEAKHLTIEYKYNGPVLYMGTSF
ncbi:MAG: hypothetical protein O6763_10075 [Gammaproteobacteria bacterium]|nr:hypothetical protein [Gammaproteobacteria bacterium]